MRISELSERSGISPASIKYYTREGLLPGGERTGYNSTEYAETHVARLRLIRALVDTGGLTVAAAGRVIAAIDDPGIPLDHVLGIAQKAMPEDAEPPSEAALDRVRAVMRERGWETVAENPGIALAAAALDGFAATGLNDEAVLSRYAAATDLVAEADLDLVAASGDRDQAAATVVVGIALGDVLLAGLRRIAQESLTHRRFRDGGVPPERREPT
ncbi:MerR family transcriptional regulator [Myceligenerans cantabricum]